MKYDLEADQSIDFSLIDLTFADFKSLAKNRYLSLNEKMGFSDLARAGHEEAILADIVAKIPALGEYGKTVVDVGSGCGPLARAIMKHCIKNKHNLILIDSEEMMSLLPNVANITKVVGEFPANIDKVQLLCGTGADVIICYSVIQHIFFAGNVFDAVDGFLSLMRAQGSTLIGDVPNISKRKRFFSSATGVAFHKAYMQSASPPTVSFNTVETRKIDDAVLAAIIQRAQASGCDAYLMPQAPGLPYANRRDDILLRKP